MKTYTTIEFFRDNEEIYAEIINNKKSVRSFCIVGEWDDDKDIKNSLEDEASRLGYVKKQIT